MRTPTDFLVDAICQELAGKNPLSLKVRHDRSWASEARYLGARVGGQRLILSTLGTVEGPDGFCPKLTFWQKFRVSRAVKKAFRQAAKLQHDAQVEDLVEQIKAKF